MAVIVAYGVRADGVREVLGMDVGLSEDVVLWRTFFQSLLGRGLHGVQLVISDAHAGLKQAIREVFVGAAWQRCRVHFLRNLLARVPKTAAAMVAATVRTIFEQPDRTGAQRQLREVCKTLRARFPHAVALLEIPAIPSACTTASTLRVLTPCTYASATTATNACSARRRGASQPGR
jgi:transposase-like protein